MRIENYTEETATHIINVDEIHYGNWRAEVVAKNDPTNVKWRPVASLESGIEWGRANAK